jgi:hypothetical protein
MNPYYWHGSMLLSMRVMAELRLVCSRKVIELVALPGAQTCRQCPHRWSPGSGAVLGYCCSSLFVSLAPRPLLPSVGVRWLYVPCQRAASWKSERNSGVCDSDVAIWVADGDSHLATRIARSGPIGMDCWYRLKPAVVVKAAGAV